jgi:glucokinase
MFLGIEIGGTKLQLGVGPGDGTFVVAPEPVFVDRAAGAEGIRREIAKRASLLIREHSVTRIGFGFGGPIDAAKGRTITSHQIAGWNDFPLVEWCRETLRLPAVIGNDADLAALAEARFGAGRGRDPVFYVTVGTGIGGGFVRRGSLYHGFGPAAAEIGHLRPGLDALNPDETVEAIASGLALERAAAALADEPQFAKVGTALNAETLAWAAKKKHAPSRAALDRAFAALGWAIAQVVTLLAPEVVVVGGGVAKMKDVPFYDELRRAVERYVFPPLRGSYEIVPPTLGEAMVIHGALALAAEEVGE